MILLSGLGVFMFSEVAQAAIALRASANSSVTNRITLRGSSSGNNAGGSTSLSIAMPTGVVQGDVMVMAVTARGTQATITPPTGWTSLQKHATTGTIITQQMFWKQAGAGEAGPYVWTLSTSGKASGVILAYTNTAPSSPIDVSGGQANSTASATITAPTVTTTVANDMLVGFFGEANSATYTATTMTTLQASSFSTGGTATTRTGTAGADQLLGAAGATGTKTATTGTTSSVNIGQVVAIKPNPATSLTLTKPAGTVQNDVVIAAVTITGNTTFTAPAGWTSIQRTVTAGNEIATQSWYIVAGASEPASYTWSWTGAQRATGVILTYSGVDTAAPIDTSGSQANASSTTIMAPSVTTTNWNGVGSALVGVFGIANAGTITPTAPLSSRDYAANSAGTTLTATRIADQSLSTSGATGTRTATAGTAGVNTGQLIALKPQISTLTQASHRWYDPGIQAGINWRTRSTTVNNSWNSVTYGNGLFVAVSNTGTGNRVMTSSDGITWTSRTSAADNSWQSVTYGNGLFVAVSVDGISNYVMTMLPPVNWGGALENNRGAVTPNANDPTQGASTIVNQNYLTNNLFTPMHTTPAGQYARWDFDLDLSRAPYEGSYCFRMVNADGAAALNAYSTYPQITRCTTPTVDRRLRTGAAFCSGSKQRYWSRAVNF